MQTVTPTPIPLDPNPFIPDLRQIGKWVFLFLMAAALLFLLLKIILDFRRYHYKD